MENEINQEMRDKKYNNWGRYYPAIVSLVFPLVVCVFTFQEYNEKLETAKYIISVILSFGAIVPALFFFYVFVMRELSKLLIESPIRFLFGYPERNLMLSSNDNLDPSMKTRIKDFVKTKYEIDLDSPSLLENSAQKKKFKKAVAHMVSIMREEESVRKHAILFEFNCVYGFFRNLSGGLLLNIIICVVILYLNSHYELGYESFISISLYILLSLFLISILFTISTRLEYAKRLYIVFESKCVNG